VGRAREGEVEINIDFALAVKAAGSGAGGTKTRKEDLRGWGMGSKEGWPGSGISRSDRLELWGGSWGSTAGDGDDVGDPREGEEG
jgi:hypothetical protein